MKKQLLVFAALVAAVTMITACDKNKDNGPDPVEMTELWMVEKLEAQDAALSTTTFAYNDNHSLALITLSDGSKTEFTYDTEGNLIKSETYKMVDGVKSVTASKSFEYDGNKIIAVQMENKQTTTLVYTLNDNGLPAEYTLILNASNPLVEDKFEYEYDSKGRMTSWSRKRYFDGAFQPPMPSEQSGNTFKYDEKNSIVHNGMLPGWYFNLYNITGGYRLFPVNNMIETNSVGGTFGGKVEYSLTYNENDYPTESGILNSAGEKIPNSTYKITYKVVEVPK